jgi:hypothetical protein
MKKMKPGGKQNSEENEDELDMGTLYIKYLKLFRIYCNYSECCNFLNIIKLQNSLLTTLYYRSRWIAFTYKKIGRKN